MAYIIFTEYDWKLCQEARDNAKPEPEKAKVEMSGVEALRNPEPITDVIMCSEIELDGGAKL